MSEIQIIQLKTAIDECEAYTRHVYDVYTAFLNVLATCQNLSVQGGVCTHIAVVYLAVK